VLADLLTEMGSYRDALSQLEILESMTPSASGVIERLNTVRNLARRSDLQSVPQND
jgi:protein involved in temperature-dependent protein secretion